MSMKFLNQLLSYKSLRLFKLTYLIFLQFAKRNKRILLIFLALTLFLLIPLSKINFFREKEVLIQGFVGTFQMHDLPLETTKLLSEGLVKTGDDGKMNPNLAKSWESNNDATVFKFKLKDSLKWTDQTEVKSTDLEFSIPNVEVSFPDDRTIEFRLKEPYAPFPSLLTKPIFKKGTLTGVGPYQLKKLEKSKIFITKVELVPIKEDLPQINFRYYPNEKTAVTGLSLGEIHALLGINNKTLLENPQIKVYQKTDRQEIVTLLYNTGGEILGNRSVRQALSYILPKIEAVEEANTPFSSFSWAYDKSAKKYLENKKESEEALERAKSSAGEKNLQKELILTTTPYLEEVGKKIVTSWKNLGFDAKLRVESGIPQNFQALLITQTIPDDPDQYFLWHSTQTKTNLSSYSSARVDKDLEDARKTTNIEARKEKYFDFQRALMEDAPAAFLYYPKYNVFYLRKVENQLMKVLPLQL